MLVGPLPRDIAEMSPRSLHGAVAELRQAIAVARAALLPVTPDVYTRSCWLHEALRRWYVGGEP